jgi:hypothetical protein
MKPFATLSLLILSAAPLFQAATVDNQAAPPVAVKFLNLFENLRSAPDADADHKHVAFKFSESEINEYLRYSLKTVPRPGLDSVTVKLFPKDYISAYARVDFDAIEQWSPGTIPTVLRPLLKGKKAVWIDCRVHAADSNLTFTVEKARYDDVPLPAFFVNKMIQIIAARQPEKYDTSKPMPLPFGLNKVWTEEHLLHGNN